MNETELMERVVEVESRSKSNTKRIDELSESMKSVKDLITSVAVMAEQMKSFAKSQEQIQKDVADLKAIPARRWETVVEKILIALVGAIVAFVIAKLS